jgi:hypothetical protein
VKLARAVLDGELRARATQPPLEAPKRARAELAAALAALALEQQPQRSDAALALAQAELMLGHVDSAAKRLEALKPEADDEKDTDTWHKAAMRLLDELHTKLWKPKVPMSERTPKSPAGKLKDIGKDTHMPISAALDGGAAFKQLTSSKQLKVNEALHLVSPLCVDRRLVADAMAARTPHRAKLGSWNLRCSAGYHECRKTLQAKLEHVAALARSEQWSVIALQEAPGAAQRSDDAIQRGLLSTLGAHWRWHEVALGKDQLEVGGFAYDTQLWTREELEEPAVAEKDAFKRAPVCILLRSVTQPQTILALASVHLKARSAADAKPGGDADEDDADAGEDGRTPSTRAMAALEATRLEVKALAAQGGVAARLITAAEQSVAGQPAALAFVAVLGDFNLSWTTTDPFCNPTWPGSQASAWNGLSALGFDPLIADGRATNAHEVMLSRCEHCFDNCLVRLVKPPPSPPPPSPPPSPPPPSPPPPSPSRSCEAPPPRVRDASSANVAPWPPALAPLVARLEAVVQAARDAAGDCAQLCDLAEAGIRRSVRDQMLREASDHRALTIVFEAAEEAHI